MQTDPMEEWRRLTTLYGEMGDVEIRELADQINDLTPNAQQVLRDELRKRGIVEDAPTSTDPAATPDRRASVNWEPLSYRYEFNNSTEENDGPHEYTWKVPLCECDTTGEARQVAEVLRRAGIDSWIEANRSSWGMGGPRVLVGADQLEKARSIAAQPIPQDVIDQTAVAESAANYEPSVCPKCGAEDPTLESVEPSNNWLCESCGYTWSDPVVSDTQGGKSSA